MMYTKGRMLHLFGRFPAVEPAFLPFMVRE
jgi:hypothetical protein